MSHTIEKIGGTSMSRYDAVRDNIVLGPDYADNPYQRIFVVSAYGGITDQLLEHKKTGQPGVYGLYANADEESAWEEALERVTKAMNDINLELFPESDIFDEAQAFISERIEDARVVLQNLQQLCQHGHFEIESQLLTVREMLASLGEAHSAWSMARALRRDGVNARFIDLSGWKTEQALPLDEVIEQALSSVDVTAELPIVTGYAHCSEGLMASFDRGYSEMTFSRLAVVSKASEAVIHKEYHLSSADPRQVGADKVVPIGRTNYDVADQLANLGMEAIHPRAAKGLRKSGIPLRVKNTFEPEHTGTLITSDYVSETPRVEIIAGRSHVLAIELFDQDMAGDLHSYDSALVEIINRFRAHVVNKDINANSITHYLDASLKAVKRIAREMEKRFPSAEIDVRQVAIVSAIGSDMKMPGLLAKAVNALAEGDISILATHQCMRQVDMQFIVDESDYDKAVQQLHKTLIEAHDHGYAICAA